MKKILTIASLITLAACSTQKQPIDSNTHRSILNNLNYPIYGKLENNNGTYSFTEYSETFNEAEPWVDLSNMLPMWNTLQEDCSTGLVEYTNPNITCKSANERLFREKGVDLTLQKASGYVVLSALSFGVGAAITPGAVKFNERKYYDAIKSATNQLKKQADSDITTTLENYNKEMIALNNTTSALIKSYTKKSKPSINLIDKTGLFKEPINIFKDNITLSKSTPKPLNKNISSPTLKAFSSRIHTRNQQYIDSINKLTSSIKVYCKNIKFSNFEYSIQCPKTIKSSDKNFDVNITVNSMDFQNILPNTLTAEDDNIRIIYNNDHFDLVNKTDSYITIDSISFYHNKKIATSSKLDFEAAPQSEYYLIDMDRLPIDKDAIHFANITKSKAKNTLVQYGIALKYKIINTDKEKTLFNTQYYLLDKLI